MKKLIGLFLLWPSVLFAQSATLIVSDIPTPSASCTIQRNAGNTAWTCTAGAAASQPLTDSLGLIADNVDPTKILALQLSGLTTGTTRTWTIADANITIPSTIASLSTNTFTGLQTANGGIATTTLTLSSTVQSDVLFTDATYDIGKSGATRPRDGFFSRNFVIGGTLGVTGNVTFSGTGNTVGTITSGVWNAGAVTSSGLITSGTGGFFGSINIAGTQINETGTNSNTGEVSINYNGYNNGTTVYRVTKIYDGKNAVVAAFTGSDKSATFAGAVTFSSTIAVTSTSTLAAVNAGAVASNGQISTTLITDSSSSATGSIITSGGVGIAKQLYVGSSTGAAASPYTYLNGLRLSGGDTGNTIYQPQGDFGLTVQSGTLLLGGLAAGGVSIQASHASGAVRFYAGGASEAMRIVTSRALLLGLTSGESVGAGSMQATGQFATTSANPFMSVGKAVATATGTAAVWYDNGTHLFIQLQSSSARYKENITPWVVPADALTRFLALSPKNWDYKGQRNGAAGFISEDLNGLGIVNAYGTSPLVNYDGEGRPESNRDFAIIGLQHLVLRDHDARLAALEARAGITRSIPTGQVDLQKQDAAQKAEATRMKASFAAVAAAEKRVESVKASIAACKADNDMLKEHKAKLLDCTPDAESKAVAKLMADAEQAAAEEQKKQQLAECSRKNTLITKQGGTPLVCEAR